MATMNFLIPLLVTFMLITGVCNTLLTKYQVVSVTSGLPATH
jgi:hypothetical protein